MTRTPALAVLLALSAGACLPSAPAPEVKAGLVDARFAGMNEGDHPGLAVAVIENGGTVHTAGYGLANLEDHIPITPRTVFDIASISKQFTGLSIAMLIQEGEVSLDDDVHTYLPELAAFGPTITIDNLVHHTSGIRDWPGSLAVGGWSMSDVISFDQILDFAFHQRTLNFEPGSEYTYSNTGYNLLAETVQRVSGRSFRSWTEEHLFRPLGMTSTHFHDDYMEVVPDRAWGYASDGDGGWKRTPNNLTALGSSSLYTTVEDLAKWVANMGTGAVGGEAQELWRTPGLLADGSENSYAFGIVNDEYRGTPMLQHSGGWASFNTYLLYLPEHDFGVVVLANHPTNVGSHARAIVDIWLGDMLGPADPSETAGAPADVQVSRELMTEYEGTYRLGPGWYVDIVLGPDGLTTQATREDAFPMTPRTEEEFWVEAYGSTITFLRDDRGEVDAIEYRGERRPRMSPGRVTTAELDPLAGIYESEELRTAYEVLADDDGLVLTHPRHGEIRLEQAPGGEFTGSAWFMQAVEFRRDSDGPGASMIVYAGERNRNIVFRRRR